MIEQRGRSHHELSFLAIWLKMLALVFYFLFLEGSNSSIWLKKISERVGEMAQSVVLFTTKPGDLSLMLETHMVDGGK